jgi:hypothetical protein
MRQIIKIKYNFLGEKKNENDFFINNILFKLNYSKVII